MKIQSDLENKRQILPRLITGLRSLLPFIVVVLVFAYLIKHNTLSVYSLSPVTFQSPIVEPATPTPPLPTDTPVVVPTETPTLAPPTATLPPPTNTSLPTLPPPQPVAATATPPILPTPTLAPVTFDVPGVDNQPAADVTPDPGFVASRTGFIINEVALIDTLLQWFAWFWMCFGVAVILIIPLFFVYLQIRGRK